MTKERNINKREVCYWQLYTMVENEETIREPDKGVVTGIPQYGFKVRLDHEFPEKWSQKFRPRFSHLSHILPVSWRWVVHFTLFHDTPAHVPISKVDRLCAVAFPTCHFVRSKSDHQTSPYFHFQGFPPEGEKSMQARDYFVVNKTEKWLLVNYIIVAGYILYQISLISLTLFFKQISFVFFFVSDDYFRWFWCATLANFHSSFSHPTEAEP